MRQAERPEPQVGCCVGDTAQAVLNGVDRLVHEDFRKVKVLQGGKEHGRSAGGTDTLIPPPSLPGCPSPWHQGCAPRSPHPPWWR